ncbi:hypothetical protein [Pendulispora albinea]|uniref:Uncharacterized protein n=1 Tax=Pendulispora albinea TaxID=2741071 RepID=A0ABZ2M034_9BACT
MGTKTQNELEDLFTELDQLLKNPDVQADLNALGVNSSLAIVAAEGLRAYLRGEKARAAEDFSTVGEEIAHRARVSKGTSKPS